MEQLIHTTRALTVGTLSEITMKPNPRILRHGLLSVGVIAAAAAAYLKLTHTPTAPRQQPVRPVKTLTVRSIDEAEVLTQTGEIQPRTETALGFQLGGKVIQRAVEVGDTVTPGMVLAALDDSDVSNELRSAEADLSGAISLENQATLAHQRAAGLLKISAISKADAEAAEASFRAAVAKREAAQSLVQAARQKKSYALLTAREEGIVTSVSANVGQVIAPGQSIVSIASRSEREAVFAVPEALIHLGSPEMPVEVFLASDPRVKTVGKVREVSPNADPDTRTFRVRVSLPGAPEEMALGVSVQGKAMLPSRRTFQLPPSSLTAVDGEPAVYVVQRTNSTLVRRPIKVSRFSKDVVSIAEGLSEGDVVVTAGVSKLRPNQTVKIEMETTR
jgi:membrane fusion protein, multidrug efflux system